MHGEYRRTARLLLARREAPGIDHDRLDCSISDEEAARLRPGPSRPDPSEGTKIYPRERRQSSRGQAERRRLAQSRVPRTLRGRRERTRAAE